MNVIYISVVISICAIATFAVNKKYMALPYVLCVTILPAHVNIIVGTVNVWGLDLLSVVIIPIIIIRGGLRRPFHFSSLDLLLPFMCFWMGVCRMHAGDDVNSVFQGVVRSFSPWCFPYFIARMGCRSWESLRKIMIVLSWWGVFLAFATMFEALTGQNVLTRLVGIGSNPHLIKWGIFRSRGTMSSFHILGMALAVLGIYAMALFMSKPKKHSAFLIVSGILLVGVITSTSATGVMLAIMGMMFLSLYGIREHVPRLLTIFFFLNVIAHFASQDGIHFVYARRLGFLGEAWYRAKLIDETIAGMSSKMIHWVFGMGNTKIKVGTVDDMCNMWLLVMVLGGLPGFFALISFFVGMLLRLKRAYLLVYPFSGERLLLWGILSVFVAMAGAWFYIALYGSDIAFYSFFFGLVVNLPDLANWALHGGVTSKK